MNEFPFLKNSNKKDNNENEFLDETFEPNDRYQDDFTNQIYGNYNDDRNGSFINRNFKTIIWAAAFFVVVIGLVGVFLFSGRNQNKVIEADINSYKDIPENTEIDVYQNANNTNVDTIQEFLEQQQINGNNTLPEESQVIPADALANQRSIDANAVRGSQTQSNVNENAIYAEPQEFIPAPVPASPPVVKAEPKVAPKPVAKPAPVAKATPKPAPKPAVASNWTAQIFAVSTMAKAESGIKDVQAKYPNLFKGKTLFVVEGESAGKAVYRVRVKPFQNSTEAGNFCKTVRAGSNLSCNAVN